MPPASDRAPARRTNSSRMSDPVQAMRQLLRFPDPYVSYGRAVNFLRGTEPFASFQFGPFAASIAGQIERDHYLFATQDAEVVGYFGWAMCEEKVARAWVEGRYVPSFAECQSGDWVVGMTFHTTTPEVRAFMVREAKRQGLFRDRRVIFTRHYAGKAPRIGRMLVR